MKPTSPVVSGSCLICGHVLPFRVYVSGSQSGVCRGCYEAARVNVGDCSPERGCRCAEWAPVPGDESAPVNTEET